MLTGLEQSAKPPLYKEINYYALIPGVVVIGTSFFYPFSSPNNRHATLGAGLTLMNMGINRLYERIAEKAQNILKHVYHPVAMVSMVVLGYSLHQKVTKVQNSL